MLIQLAIRLVSLDPLRESVHRTLMTLYVRQRQHAAALKQYRTCQAVLRRELGLAPDPETEHLYREILQGRRKPASATAIPEEETTKPITVPSRNAHAINRGPELRPLTIVAVRTVNPNAWSYDGDAVSRESQRYRGLVIHRNEECATVVFGIPIAYGNEFERAVRAAVAIRRALAEAGSDTGIGIASGQALASVPEGGHEPDYEVHGKAVEMAMQLAAQASAGEFLITEAIYHGTAGYIPTERLPGEPPVWRVPASGVWRQTVELPTLVGRRAELRQFRGATETCLEIGCGQTFLVRGEAGIGKTRLVKECKALAEALGFGCHQGQLLDFGTATGQDAIATLVRSLLDLPHGVSDSTDIVRKFVDMKPDQQALLNHLLELPQPAALRTIIDAMDDSVRRREQKTLISWLIDLASQQQPRLLIVEDIHWADTEALKFLAQIALTVKDCSALLVMTSRVEGEPLDPNWRGAMQLTPLTTLDLGPLRSKEALTLGRTLSGGENSFVRCCVERAGGNPLFLEQLLRVGNEDDVVPDSVQSLVWARLDRLSPMDKQAVQAAAVLGQRFTLAALHHLIEHPDYRCEDLIQQRWIRSEYDDYEFIHALIRQGIYVSLPPPKRRLLHQRAADWYRTRDTILYAQHLECAEDREAAAAYLEAAQAHAHAHRYDRALALIQQGLLIVQHPEIEYELTCLHGELLSAIGKINTAIDEFEHALSLTDDEEKHCRAWLGMAEGLIVQDRYQEALALLGQAEAAMTRRPCPQILGQIHGHRGNILFSQGRTNDCLQEHELALALARQAAVPALEARALGGLGDAYYQRGRLRVL